jgi:hypothetical protein
LIPFAPFAGVVHRIMAPYGSFRITRDALNALQEAAEAILITEFESKFGLIILLNYILIFILIYSGKSCSDPRQTRHNRIFNLFVNV